MGVIVLHSASNADSVAPKLSVVPAAQYPIASPFDLDIEAVWQARTAQAQRVGRPWYNGPLWRALGLEEGCLTVTEADFRGYVGTRELDAQVPADQRISPVGVAVLPVEVDRLGGRIRRVRFFRRAGNSLAFAGYLSGLGGMMDPNLDGLDPAKAALREVAEESGLKVPVQCLTYLGLVQTTPTYAVNYCYLLEIESKTLDQGVVFADGEHTHSIAIPVWLAKLVVGRLSPAADWVKAFGRMVLDQHGHRI